MSDGPYSNRSVNLLTGPVVQLVLKLAGIAALLYLFLLSITLLGASFKLLGGSFVEALVQATSNPLVGLCIGLLSTAIIQSSSSTTTMIVTMVASGTLSLPAAIPMVMGANIGTSITNTIVSIAHVSRKDEFKRAFAGSLVHDIFNICSVIVLLPLQIKFNIIGWMVVQVEHLFAGFGGLKFSSVNAITKPVAKEILHLTGDTTWLGILIALVLLFIALRYMVVVIKSLVLVRVEKFFDRFIFRTPALGFILGVFLTALVQSSSITTSIVIPLIGAGVITIPQVFPYMLGANVGTTITAFLASFALGSPAGVGVAFAHLIFNVYGIAIFWPLKQIPIGLANALAAATQKTRLIPILYIAVVFFIIPGLVLFLMD
ncbi:MAG: Na/Pi symporter [bacterium]